jgi:hypothetical protein
VMTASCRKTDSFLQPSAVPQPVNKAAVERFLTLPDNAGSDLQRIVADLRKRKRAILFSPHKLKQMVLQPGNSQSRRVNYLQQESIKVPRLRGRKVMGLRFTISL